jgi:hypothetical protein
VATLNGRCDQLIVAGAPIPQINANRTSPTSCSRTTGSISSFSPGALTTVRFGGLRTRLAKTGENTASQPVDQLMFTSDAPAPQHLPATGACTYSNPDDGPSDITCSVHRARGEFKAEFVTDGQAPSTKAL